MGNFDDSQIRWTLRLVRCLQLLLGALIIFCIYRYQSSLNPYFSGTLLFTSILSLIVIFALASVEKGLQFKKHYSWTGARIISVLGLVTPALPLAILSARETFSAKNTQSFLSSKTIYSDQKLGLATRLSVAALCILCVTGGTMYGLFQKNSAFLDVAFQEVSYKLPPNSSAKDLYAIAGECNSYGKSKCAIAAFLQILKQNPGDTKALANLAMAQSHYGQHKLAVSNFERALDKGYRTYDVYYFYGKSLQKTRYSQMAIDAYQAAIRLNPDLVDAAANIALIMIDQGQFEQALKHIQNYLDTNPAAFERFRAVQENLKQKIQDV